MSSRKLLVATAALLLALPACASSNSSVVRLTDVWSATCGGVVVSASTLADFHEQVQHVPECARGYTATAPSKN